MKKRTKKVLLFLLIFLVLVANSNVRNISLEATSKETRVKPKKIKLNYKTKNLAVGEKVILSVSTVKPSNASKDVIWKSSNNKIATVNSKGKVRAKKIGKVSIIAKSAVDEKIMAKCRIRVYKATKKLKLHSEKSYILTVGDVQKLSAKVTKPKNGAAPVEWSSADTNIAKVNKKGQVTAISPGKTVVIAKSGKKKLKVFITVNEVLEEQSKEDSSQEEQPKEDSSQEEQPVKILHSGDWNGMDWSIDEKGTFTLSQQEMESDSLQTNEPAWKDYAQTIKTVVVTAEDVTSTENWFYGCINLTSVNMTNFDTSDVTSMKNMFMGCGSLTDIKMSFFDTRKVTDMSGMFAGCSSLTSVDVSSFDTSKVTDLSGMFWQCGRLESVDVSKFDTRNVISMESMFENCNSLTSLDVSNFNTGNVTNLGFMFSGCNSLPQLDVSKFDTGKVTDMRGMFQRCSGLRNIDVSKFDTGSVRDMAYMFSCCSSLEDVDITGFDTSKVEDMNYMFQNCNALQK